MALIAVINKSTMVKDADIETMCQAIDTQVKRDFCPEWDLVASSVEFVADPTKAPSHAWVISIIDDQTSVPDALGYHQETGDKVIGFIMAKPILDNQGAVMAFDPNNAGQYTVSATLSHEVLEMLGDRDTNIYCDIGDASWCREVCDPVEQIGYGIEVNGVSVAVSDFVLRSFFNPQASRAVNGKFNHLDTLEAPFTCLSGGYAVVRTGGPGTEKQIFGRSIPAWRKAVKRSEFSRGGRRANAGRKSVWARFVEWITV